MTPEAKARQTIDALLTAAGWHVCNVADANIHAAVGVAIRVFPLNPGFGYADYLLYVNGKACGVIEAKKEGTTLTGVELQSSRYAKGLPTTLPAWSRPLPFVWESTGVETHFTNGLDPEPRARSVFAFLPPGAAGAMAGPAATRRQPRQRQRRQRIPQHLPGPHAQHAQHGELSSHCGGQRQCFQTSDRGFNRHCANDDSLSGLRSIAIGLPPKAEKARIVTEVNHHLPVFREVEAEGDTNLRRAQALRQATLSKVFTI